MNTAILAPDQYNYLKSASVFDAHQRTAERVICHFHHQYF